MGFQQYLRKNDVSYMILPPIAALITSLQIAYVLGLLSSSANRKAAPVAPAMSTAPTGEMRS